VGYVENITHVFSVICSSYVTVSTHASNLCTVKAFVLVVHCGDFRPPAHVNDMLPLWQSCTSKEYWISQGFELHVWVVMLSSPHYICYFKTVYLLVPWLAQNPQPTTQKH